MDEPKVPSEPGMAPQGKVRSGALHSGLVEAVRELINRGELSPGSRVPEKELCERFSISRTPLREALKVLAADGLIELLPNRGARVATFDDNHLTELFELIGILEAEAGRLACERMSDAAIADVQALHYRMYAHYLRKELPEYFALNQEIHEAIIDGSGNSLLIMAHRNLARRIIRVRYMSNRLDSERWAAAIQEHSEIVDALVRRDREALPVLLSRHLAHGRDVVAEHMRESERSHSEISRAGRSRKASPPNPAVPDTSAD